MIKFKVRRNGLFMWLYAHMPVSMCVNLFVIQSMRFSEFAGPTHKAFNYLVVYFYPFGR